MFTRGEVLIALRAGLVANIELIECPGLLAFVVSGVLCGVPAFSSVDKNICCYISMYLQLH